MTAWLARRLLEAGRRPLIALRGYGARHAERSDEAMEYAALLPDVPLAIGADRVRAIAQARRVSGSGTAAPDVILLDDGFQHRQVSRAIDLVLVDAGRPCLEGREAALLPRGWLREPPAALRRADAVVLTHAERVSPALLGAVRSMHGKPPLALFRHVWRCLDRHEPNEGSLESASAEVVPVTALRGLRVVALLGVAQPRRVRAMAEEAGAEIVAELPVRDHQRYDQRLIDRLRRAARTGQALLTTPKDWTKLAPHLVAIGRPVLVPRLDVEAIEGGEALTALVAAAQR
jgi:tetraacyldisaccharide 4'-kinase